jgi:hypothetical protein
MGGEQMRLRFAAFQCFRQVLFLIFSLEIEPSPVWKSISRLTWSTLCTV